MEESILQYVPVKKIVVNVLNPRKDMGDIDGLRKSIINQGLIQPLIVRQYKGNGKFELTAGERRFTAIQEAIGNGELPKNYEVPVIVKNVDDQQVVQMMFVENLMRKDLSEYEQAVSFKEYLDKIEDPDAIKDLAEKTGVNIQYIRRRAKVLDLPESVQELWKSGKLAFSHLEQLLRVDPEKAIELAEDIIDHNWSISYLKSEIERSKAILSNALFDIKTAGCGKCQYSTKVQKALFGEDFKADNVMCTNPKCYFEKQTEFITADWQNLPDVKKNKTNGVVISSKWGDTISISGKTDPKCAACEHYVTQMMLDGTAYHEKACKGGKFCHNNIYGGGSSSSNQVSMTPEAKQQRKADNLGKEFSQIFYRENLPGKIASAKSNDVRLERITLYSLVNAYRSIAKKVIGLTNEQDYSDHGATFQAFTDSILVMTDKEIREFTKKMADSLVFNTLSFDLRTTKLLAEQFDSLIERDFVMNEDFLNKKTKAQLIELSTKHGIIKSHTENELSAMKKSDIIPLITAKDLSGIIPDEIIAVAEGKPEVEEVIEEVED